MKNSLLLLLSALAACATGSALRADLPGAAFSAQVRVAGLEWSMSSLVADATRDTKLTSLGVSVFEDLDGDRQLSPGESRGSWWIRTTSGSRQLATSGMLQARQADTQEALAQLLIRVEIGFADGHEETKILALDGPQLAN